jgi:glutamate racemase
LTVSRHEHAAIGVFDSGIGGLTVARALLRAMPGESLLYLGDTARLPYGTKSPDTVARYTRRNVTFLLEQGVKAVVIACNTASATGLDGLATPVPTWGVIEPGARAAAAASRGRVGVTATDATIRSGVYPRALNALRPGLSIFTRACPLFVPLVEEGWEDDPVAEAVAERYLEPLLAEHIDTLVLGCTHYPMLESVIRRVAGDDIVLVDSAATIAAEVSSALAAAGLSAREGAAPRHRLLVTDAAPQYGRFASRILGPDLELERVDVVD